MIIFSLPTLALIIPIKLSLGRVAMNNSEYYGEAEKARSPVSVMSERKKIKRALLMGSSLLCAQAKLICAKT